MVAKKKRGGKASRLICSPMGFGWTAGWSCSPVGGLSDLLAKKTHQIKTKNYASKKITKGKQK
jgi:hypothetical protein